MQRSFANRLDLEITYPAGSTVAARVVAQSIQEDIERRIPRYVDGASVFVNRAQVVEHTPQAGAVEVPKPRPQASDFPWGHAMGFALGAVAVYIGAIQNWWPILAVGAVTLYVALLLGIREFCRG